MRNRENVYAHVEEKHVMTVKVYANEANVLFYDEACEKAVLADIVEELFLKGITVVYEGALLKPVASAEAVVVCHNGIEAVTFTATEPVEE